MENMSALEQALDILPITVDDKAVKEAVIIQLALSLSLNLASQWLEPALHVAGSACNGIQNHKALP